mgnify:CR=1 FL=1
MKRLSVIIPMYNVEPYVERCLRSLLDQDLHMDEYEIICINDGSPDNSREVVIALQEDSTNIKLIDQENKGVSMARNIGIENAAGKYLLMVDPDDYLEPNSLKDKLDIMDQEELEIGITGYVILNEAMEREYVYDPKYNTSEVITGAEYFDKHQKGNSEIRDPHRSVAIFFQTDFYMSNGLLYLSDVPYLEDEELMTRAMCLANRVSFLNHPLYLRTTRPGSATHSKLLYTEKAKNGFLKAAKNLAEFKILNCNTDEQKGVVNQSIIHFTILCITPLGLVDYIRNYKSLHTSIKKGPLKKLDYTGCSNWYIMSAKFYNFSMNVFYLKWMIHKINKSIKIRIKRLF